MHDTVTLDIFPPFDYDDDGYDDDVDSSTSEYAKNFNKSSPVILFAPGLRCYSQDMPGNSIVRRAYAMGIRSIVVNRRGHTPNQPLKSPRWNLFGDVDDMEQVYWYIKDQHLVTHDTAFFLYGVSSGTAVTVTSLSKWDKRRSERNDNNNDDNNDDDDDDTPNKNQQQRIPAFVASVDVAPGYDTSKVMNRDRFLWPYNDILMAGVKDTFVLQNEQILRAHDSEAVDRMLSASSLQEFVDAGVSFAGYNNTAHYYQDTNPINELRDITTPKLVLNAMDDPCCHIGNLYEASPYPQHHGKTYAEMIRETERGLVAVAHTGSHCPFLCNRNRLLPFVRDPLSRNGWMLNSWADEVTIDFFLAALDIYNERRFLK
jgi:predicted alpha/beta-fold hydrolase